MALAPILLFVYNRPQHVRRCIESLLQNEIVSQSKLFVYADGARHEDDEADVQQTRDFIHTIVGFKSVDIIERETNQGLAANIIDGVSTQVKAYGKVIVLEDDLVVAPYFLQFMNNALTTYQDDTKVGHIHGCDFTQNNLLPNTFLIKWTGSWGWATWERAWKHFNPNGSELLKQLEKGKLTYVFDFNGKYGYTRMLKRQIEGKNNSWAIRWNASLFLQDILSLNVGKSLVQNEGFDGSGTNCGKDGLYSTSLWLQPLEVNRIKPIIENEKARNVYVAYYRRTNSFIAKALRRIKLILNGNL